MALQTSGPIDISDLNVELGNPATTQLNLGGAAARDLAGVPSGAIRLGADFYGKSSIAYFYHWLTFSTYSNNVTSSAIDSNDNIIYGGYLDYLTFSKTGWVKSYDVDGNLNWSFSRVPGTPGLVTRTKVVVDSSDNVYLIVPDSYTHVYKFNSSGTLLYSNSYSFSFIDVAIDGTYLYFVDGPPLTVHKVNCSNLTYNSGKYSSYTNGYGGNYYSPRAIAVSSAGKMLITGQAYNSNSTTYGAFFVELNSDFTLSIGNEVIMNSTQYGYPATNNYGSGVSAGYHNGTTPAVAYNLAVNTGSTSQWGVLAYYDTSGNVTYLKKVSENIGDASRLKTVGTNLYGVFSRNSPSALACFVKLSSTASSSGSYSFSVKNKSGSNVTVPTTLHAGGESSTGFYVFGGGSDAGGIFKAASDFSTTGSYDGGSFTLGTSNTIQNITPGTWSLAQTTWSWPFDTNTSVSTSAATLSSGNQPSVTSYNI